MLLGRCKNCLVLAEMNEALCDIEYTINIKVEALKEKIILMS